MATLDEYHLKNLEQFLESIRPWSEAYIDATFAFIGIRNGKAINILAGHLYLPHANLKIQTKIIDAESVVGCQFQLTDINETYESFLRKLSSDTLDTKHGNIRLLPDANEKNANAHHTPFYSSMEIAQPRVDKLSFTGSFPHSIDAAILQLRSAETPYDSLEELANDLSIPNFRRDTAVVEVTAYGVAQIDLSKRVEGSKANLGILLSPYLDSNQCSFGYKIVHQGVVKERKRLSGNELHWENETTHRLGSIELAVPLGATVQCFASYKGHIQHHAWIIDPDTFPNFLRVLHHGFDTNLKTLKTYLFDEVYLSKYSRDFEAGVANLLFLLGFTIDPLLGKLLEDNPDIIAITKTGNIALIECTTNQINKDAKIGKLVDRTEMIKAQLKKGSFAQKIIPIIVTAKPRSAVVDIDTAKRNGVLVRTKEDLEAAVERTLVYFDPDVIFNQWWNELHQPEFITGM